MPPWNTKKTLDLVGLVFGRAQEDLARESIRSINDRQAFASYHFREMIRLTKSFEKQHLSDAMSILDMHAQGEEATLLAFQRYMIKAGAHTLAAVQSLHALPDIFAHAVYFSSAQNLQPHAIRESEISVASVVALIKNDAKFKPIARPLAELQSGKGWSHLAAVCNTSKHRSVVRASYNEDMTGTRANFRELQVSNFKRNGKAFPSISVRELLEPEYLRLMGAIVSTGNLLNSCLSAAKS